MDFGEVSTLHEDFCKYLKGEGFTHSHAHSSLQTYFTQKLDKFESEVTQKSHGELKEEFDKIQEWPQKYLLHSLNDSYSGQSIPAFDNLRRYIDRTLVQMSKNRGIEHETHNSVMPYSSMNIRLGNLDEGLISLIECIKLAQNKKDNYCLIKSLVWLQQIVKAFGNVEQAQMLIVEQILINCCIYNLPHVYNNMALEYSQLAQMGSSNYNKDSKNFKVTNFIFMIFLEFEED